MILFCVPNCFGKGFHLLGEVQIIVNGNVRKVGFIYRFVIAAQAVVVAPAAAKVFSSATTWKPIDRFCIAIQSVVKRYKEQAR